MKQSNSVRDSVGNLLGRNNIESLNFFEEPAQYTAHINNFVEEFTKKQIRNLIPPSLISQGTTFAIVNAAYFKGKWITPFDEKLTQQEAFYKEDGDKIFVDMMRQSKHENIEFECGLIKNLNTKFLKMPYKGDNGTISMFIFLPNESTSVGQLLDGLTAKVIDFVFNGETRNLYLFKRG
ncbi:serpin B4-like [Sitodiplosis mosellana]|uniref:serpin B4-like n=1 Tax=Sitodiplosis mosellana TaxID=263140 RepID=UPI0024450533|nr:serpin B4-like [Sitodiplosis mosellana]